jgi:CMP/dCMP kinase
MSAHRAGRVRPVVAIDGPAGAGKSTVTKRVADRLGYTRVDTGALYRAVAFACQEQGVDWSDPARTGEVAGRLAAPGALGLSTSGPETKVEVFGRDVSGAIRTLEMGQGASIVSAHEPVRAALLDIQRVLGRAGGVVLEGRDIGSVVFPDAEAKFYLTASVEVRAERRRLELSAKGTSPPIEQVLSEVLERDRRDSTRPVAPLVRAEDAILVDSSGQTVDEVVEAIVVAVQRVERELAELELARLELAGQERAE